jgi:hypothetical protein
MNVGADGRPVTATGVPMTAEWAIWGKEARDTEYRLLACCDGAVNMETFVEQITSFSPGSAKTWPQVTVSGFLLRPAVNYVALAIHGTAAGRHDAVGREIVYTRYFCVPYPELAAGRVGYQEMYDACEGLWPTGQDRSAQRLVLSQGDRPRKPAALAGTRQLLAMRVAALLLTDRGVSILGADGAGASERLGFLDAVMSLLPYGMRSALAGATWASSTAYDLNLRLFFADARRRGNDHVVRWHQWEEEPIGHPYAEHYLRWLTEGSPDPEAQLAELTEPTGFGPGEVATMLERLDVSYAKLPSAAVAVAPPDPVARTAAILRECGNRIRGTNPNFFGTELERLRECLQFPMSPQDRTRLQSVIADESLLSEHRSIDKKLRDQLYRLVLELGFEDPLTYEGYCEVEACLGQPAHKPLLQAMETAWLPDLRARLLAVKTLGGSDLKRLRTELSIMPAPLAEAASDKNVRPDHARILCELAIPALCNCPDPQALRQSLQVHYYLAPALQRLYPTQSQHQYEQLGLLLRAAYGKRLDRRDFPSILDLPGQMPSVALFAAAVQLADPADIPVAVYEFLASIIGYSKLDEPTRQWLLHVLPTPGQQEKAPRRRRSWKNLRPRLRTPRGDRLRLAPSWRHRGSR